MSDRGHSEPARRVFSAALGAGVIIGTCYPLQACTAARFMATDRPGLRPA